MDDSRLIAQLMQPGVKTRHWTQDALCIGDDRFTGRKPDDDTLRELEAICLSCEVFTECEKWVAPYPCVDLMAAGEWRTCPDEKAGDPAGSMG